MRLVKVIGFLLLFLSFTKVFPQDFYGYVKKGDSALFQARVDVKEGIKTTVMLKTFPNGGYKFTLSKGASYSVKISYPEHNDTTFTFTTDKNGKPSAQNITVHLKKSGVFLYGSVRTAAEFIPIKEVAVVLKNVMTREEKRITTGSDGAYIFKLEYDNNYRLSVDKRSPGIFNKYRDTVMYISTIGIDQALDYRLDIRLEEDLVKNTEGLDDYDPTKISNKNLKPEIDVVNKTYKRKTVPPDVLNPVPAPPVTITEPAAKPAPAKTDTNPEVIADPKVEIHKKTLPELKEELEKAQSELDEIKKKEAEVLKTAERDASVQKKQKKKDKDVQVVVIRDNNQPTVAQITRKKLEAEKKVRDIEEEISVWRKK